MLQPKRPLSNCPLNSPDNASNVAPHASAAPVPQHVRPARVATPSTLPLELVPGALQVVSLAKAVSALAAHLERSPSTANAAVLTRSQMAKENVSVAPSGSQLDVEHVPRQVALLALPATRMWLDSASNWVIPELLSWRALA